MLPDNVLSTTPQLAAFLPGQTAIDSKRSSYCLGGIALNDASQGLSVQVWNGILEVSEAGMGSIYIKSDTHTKSLVTTKNGCSEISLAFDQNMQPAFGYRAFGQGGIYWYDATIPGFTFVDFPSVTTLPRICLDERRDLNIASSDILAFYTRGGDLYYRQQRDRFTVERLLKTGVVGVPLKAGMGVNNRLQVVVGLSL